MCFHYFGENTKYKQLDQLALVVNDEGVSSYGVG